MITCHGFNAAKQSKDFNAATKTENPGLLVSFDDGSKVGPSVGRFNITITAINLIATIKTKTSRFLVDFGDGSKVGSSIDSSYAMVKSINFIATTKT